MEKTLRLALEQDPKSSADVLAQACARLDRWDDAQTYLDAALAKAPNRFQVNLLSACALLERNKASAATARDIIAAITP